MDKELIKKYKLEEAQKRFQQLCEYTFITKGSLNEEGEDEQNPETAQPQGQQMPPQQGAQQPAPEQGQQQAPEGDMPPQQGQDQGEQMPPQPQGEEPQQTALAEPEEEIEDIEIEQPDDEVIDVDDLTQAQEASEVKIDGVSDELQKLMSVTTKFIDAINLNNQKIDDLKSEFERRNPTEEERLNIRSQASYPYAETPKEFWDKKTAERGNYNVIYDNDVPTADEQEEFTIKKGDVDVPENDRTVLKTMDYPNKLSELLDF